MSNEQGEPSLPITIFYSYASSKKDEALRSELEKHLRLMQQEGLINGWSRRNIEAGNYSEHEVDDNLNMAQIILLLVSADFLASDYCYGHEMTQAIKRGEAGEARVIPIILRPVDWEGAPFAKFQPLPTDGKAIGASSNRDSALTNVARGIRKVVNDLRRAGIQSEDKNKRNHKKLPFLLSQDERERYVGRKMEQKAITNHLMRSPLTSVYGRGGIGKTTLVHKVLDDLQHVQGDPYPNGIICLNATNPQKIHREISLDRILTEFRKLLPGPTVEILTSALKDLDMTAEEKANTLVDVLQDEHYILLLDNLETLQDLVTGRLIDLDLQTFFQVVLTRNHRLHILVTSRVPLIFTPYLKTKEHAVQLKEGLSAEDSIELLRRLDIDNQTGLRQAPDSKLEIVAEKTRGFPRALEAVVGILQMDKLSTLDDLLDGDTFLQNQVTEFVVKEAIERLDQENIRIMEALALFGRPTNTSMLARFLSRWMDKSKLRKALTQLVSAYFVKYDDTTRVFEMHPIELDYCYNRVPLGSPNDRPLSVQAPYTRYALHYLAADCYAQDRTPPDAWNVAADLEPLLLEFDHRMKAQDYNTAAQVITSMDIDCCISWGYAHSVLNMCEQLLGKITDQQLKSATLNYLGEFYRLAGRYEQAMEYLNQALLIARDIANPHCEVSALGTLGIVSRNIGHYYDSVGYHQLALVAAREISDWRSEIYNLHNLGITFDEIGEVEQAIRYYEQTLEMAVEKKSTDREIDVLGNLGIAYRTLGQHEKAVGYFQQAIAIASRTGRKRWECIWLDNLGLAYHYFGEYEQAIEYHEKSIDIASNIKEERSKGYSLAGLGKTYLTIGYFDKALVKLSEAYAIATRIKNPRDQQCWGTIYAECYFHMGLLDDAQKIMMDIRQLVVPINDHQAAVIDGLIEAKRGEEERARKAFNDALSYAEKLLTTTPLFYAAKYTRGLAWYGLALLASDEDEKAHLKIQAKEAYRSAHINCATEGVVKDALLLLNALKSSNKDEILDEIKEILVRPV